MNEEIRRQLTDHLQPRLERYGITPGELTGHFDLVKSGLVNSLEFVELITAMEKRLGIEVDFDAALDAGDFTTFGGLIRTLENSQHG